MNYNDLQTILDRHKKWLRNEDGGERANLLDADLSGADLSEADLARANLKGTDLSGANLAWADLSGADLSGAFLTKANLTRAFLTKANLTGADLAWADLSEADLSGAYLTDADLYGAKNVPDLPWLSIVPDCGTFVGWKKVAGYIIKLEIAEDAKRSNATGRKCRCSAARVLEIQSLDGKKADIQSVCNTRYYPHITYTAGEVVLPDWYDDDKWNECSHGIHFFVTREEAVEY